MNCSYSLGVCNDDDACTVDSCDSFATNESSLCSHTTLNCTAPTICQVVVGCDRVNGCLYAPLVCPTPTDWCMRSLCDPTVGCLDSPKPCLVSDPDCYIGTCNSIKETCTTSQRSDWTTATTNMHGGVTCFAYYDKKKAAGIIAAGAVAGIVIGAVIFAALAAAGARQAYMFMQLRQGGMGAAQANPLYTPGGGSGENPLFGT